MIQAKHGGESSYYRPAPSHSVVVIAFVASLHLNGQITNLSRHGRVPFTPIPRLLHAATTSDRFLDVILRNIWLTLLSGLFHATGGKLNTGPHASMKINEVWTEFTSWCRLGSQSYFVILINTIDLCIGDTKCFSAGIGPIWQGTPVSRESLDRTWNLPGGVPRLSTGVFTFTTPCVGRRLSYKYKEIAKNRHAKSHKE